MTSTIVDHKNSPKILKDNILVKALGKSPIRSTDRALSRPIYTGDQWFPRNLIRLCAEIVSIPCEKKKNSVFKFNMDSESANTNWSIFKEKYNLDLNLALKDQAGTQLEYGSEFRSPKLLESIFMHHPLWKRLKSLLIEGGKFPLTPISEEDREKDRLEGIEYGNHKGASENLDLLKKLVHEDVVHGFCLPLPLNKIHLLKQGLLSPLNIQDQLGINEKGELIGKKRLTHNQSKVFQSGTSINNRLIEDEVQDVMYGHCLLRVIHDIVSLRRRHKNRRILIGKVDYKSAYRRGHLNHETAIQTITQIPESNLAFIALRLTFGGAACPNIWNLLSESVTDLANAILQCDDWNPDLFSSLLQDLIPEDINEDELTPFAKALELHVDIPINDKGKADCFIDDTTTVTVDINDNVKRASAAVVLAIHIVGRPTNPNNPIQRKDLVSLSKLAAEAAMEESKILLGWHLDSRRLLISLPKEKFLGWSQCVKSMLERGFVTPDELESMIGRLNHITIIIIHAKHFMSRIRHLFERSKNRRSIKIDDESREDLILHRKFLSMAHDGINMNLVTYRMPTHRYRSDACPFGMGGFSEKGRAWRFEIPPDLQFCATLNMLEHLSTIIGPWIDSLEGNLPSFSCILSQSDSTTSCGWLQKSNFKYSENESKDMTRAKLVISRSHAERMMRNKCCKYSQHIPGDTNDLADSLSRDHHLSDEKLTHAAFNLLNKQVPKDFKISPLPQEISSFLFSLLQGLPNKTQQSEKHKKGKLGLGLDGKTFSEQLKLKTTPSSTISPIENATSLSPHSHNQLETECIQKQTFRDNNRRDPRKDDDGVINRLLQQQYKGYQKEDPSKKQQKAIPFSIVRKVVKEAKGDSKKEAIGELIVGAIFFAMRSCEYSTVPTSEKRKTSLIQLRDIRFLKDGQVLNKNSENINKATQVSITFRSQKNNKKNETVTLPSSGDQTMCPVKAWAKIIKRVSSYEDTNEFSSVNTFSADKGKNLKKITNKDVEKALKSAAKTLGKHILGFSHTEIGTHLIRSGAAMAMYLDGIPIITIKMIGRWKSDSFLNYIRKQVEQFTLDITSRMLKNENFRHVPDPE